MQSFDVVEHALGAMLDARLGKVRIAMQEIATTRSSIWASGPSLLAVACSPTKDLSTDVATIPDVGHALAMVAAVVHFDAIFD